LDEKNPENGRQSTSAEHATGMEAPLHPSPASARRAEIKQAAG
jgi:hypothetical protein